MSKTLTDAGIKSLQLGATLWDTQVRGLHVRALAGSKAFYQAFTAPDGRKRRPKLGDVGVLTIGQARELARANLTAVAHGNDPVEERVNLRQSPTVLEYWQQEVWPNHYTRKKTGPECHRVFYAHVVPRIGSKKLRDVDYQDIARLHADLAATPYEANRTLSLVSKVLTLAERPILAGRSGHRDRGSNPCGLIPRYKELARKRFAKLDEIQKIGRAMDGMWDEAGPGWGGAQRRRALTFIALMIYTGMRPGEIAGARREWIDGHGVLRLPDSKTGQRDVYLSAQARGAIDRIPAPEDGTLTGIQLPRDTWDRIREMAGCKDLRLYDLRRTFATVSLAGGQSLSLIGEVLGHKTVQTTKIYARLMSEPAAALVASTGDRMAALMGGER